MSPEPLAAPLANLVQDVGHDTSLSRLIFSYHHLDMMAKNISYCEMLV